MTLTRRSLIPILLAIVSLFAASAAFAETKDERDARMKWWREARFGMFIHWGVYSVPAGTWKGQQIGGIGEWIMNTGKIPVSDYADFAKQFNPTKFNADEWVSIAKNAGMKYIVITSKHHDGFAMFHSKASPYNIYDATPFKRDPLAELAEACRKQGMKLGFYYSQAQDWHHPGGAAIGGRWDPAQNGSMDDYLTKVAVPQVKEILSNYGPIAILWWDTPMDMTRERADLLVPLLKLQPGIITNNRLGGGYDGDSETPEQFIPPTGYPGRDWETCMTMNDTWGYKSYDDNWKSPTMLIRNLVDIASKGGNYILNVGPTSEGVIPPPSVERLAEVGRWMKANSEAIYGTTASPFKKLTWGRCTQKINKLYLHVFSWPKDGKLLVPVTNKVTKAYLLTAPDQPLTAEPTAAGIALTVPANAPDPIATVVVAEIEGAPQVTAADGLTQATDGTLRLGAAEADITGENAKLEGDQEQNIGFWVNVNDSIQWQAKIDKPGAFEVEASYSCEPGCENAEYVFVIGDQAIYGKTENTGGWGTYKVGKLGTIHLTKAGKVGAMVRALRMPGRAVMNLRSITLKPVAQ